MGLLLALVLGSVGLVLVKSAFTTPPDPRIVLKEVFTGTFSLTSSSGSSGSTTPTTTPANNRKDNDPRSRWPE